MLSFIRRKQIHNIIIFAGHGAGWIEKGFYTWLFGLTGKKVILLPRSGLLEKEMEQRFFRWYSVKVLQSATMVICQSNYWLQQFKKLHDKGNYHVVYNWVQIPGKKNHQINAENTIGESSGLILLYAGWMEPWKGPEVLLEAMAIIRRKNPLLIKKLYMAGKGSMLPRLKAKYGHHADVEFCGELEKKELTERMISCDIFILPSYSEGMPNALLEAMSLGVPCIASEISSIPEIFDFETCGLTFEPGKEDDLAEKIIFLANSPDKRTELGKSAKRRIEESFNEERQLDKLLTLCKN